MDNTPKFSVSDYTKFSSSSVKRNLKFSLYESTPASDKPKSRKRKSKSLHDNIDDYVPGRKLSNVFEISQELKTEDSKLNSSNNNSKNDTNSTYDSCFSDSFLSQSEIRSCSSNIPNDSSILHYELPQNTAHIGSSSPVQKNIDDSKLTSTLEKCYISDIDYYNDLNCAKRYKWYNDISSDTPISRQKSNSAPSTPQYSGSDSESNIKKYHSCEFTPVKSYERYVKIGTPERNDLLYPQLVEVKPLQKPKSPQKLRNELKKISKPVKKRLNFYIRDFIYLFSQRTNNREVISKIFSYLKDTDLVNVVKVSNLWKNILQEDLDAFRRYKNHVKKVTISKENIYYSPINNEIDYSFKIRKCNTDSPRTRSPILNTARDNWQKFCNLSTKLSTSQTLKKCVVCGGPAILERNIVQCTELTCQYLWCNKCLSGSKTGPDNFLCTCEKFTPHSPVHDRSGLVDISNNLENPPSSSFFTSDSSFNISSLNGTANGSSGYFSQSDHEKSSSVLQISFPNAKTKPSVLTDFNKTYSADRPSHKSVKLNSFHSVVLQCMNKKLHKKDDFEPTSPPKVKLPVIGSQKSKKSLRRLCM